MINRRIVLVLGAGASKPYGFPLAGEMIQQAVAGEQGLGPKLVDLGFSLPDIEEFMQELLRSQLPSIDAFLEHRPEFLEIGKATLAFYLVSREEKNELFHLPNPEHWYRYLYGLMKTLEFEEFGENKLSVVSFNYDRSLEHYLATTLMAGHAATLENTLQVLSEIPIIHVYGKLGDLPGRGGDERAYSTELTPETLKKAVDGIRIVSEDTDHSLRFAPAHHQIATAEEIVFLGFGYHRENVSRLELHKHLQPSARVSGTVKGFTPSEFDENISPQFEGLKRNELRRSRQNTYEFLSNNLRLLGVEY